MENLYKLSDVFQWDNIKIFDTISTISVSIFSFLMTFILVRNRNVLDFSDILLNFTSSILSIFVNYNIFVNQVFSSTFFTSSMLLSIDLNLVELVVSARWIAREFKNSTLKVVSIDTPVKAKPLEVKI